MSQSSSSKGSAKDAQEPNKKAPARASSRAPRAGTGGPKPKAKTTAKSAAKTKSKSKTKPQSKTKPKTKASRTASRRAPIPAPEIAVPPPQSFLQAEGTSLVLLVVPFLVLTLAIAATEWISPPDAARRQFALLPEAQAATFALPSRGKDLAPAVPTRTLEAARPGLVPPAPTPQNASALAPEMHLGQAPPVRSVVALAAKPGRTSKCVAPKTLAQAAARNRPMQSVDREAFGRKLAKAALAQTRDLVVYKDAYRQIAFPMGDVPAFYGVCTDVIVRAYRTLGVDLQVLVHKARIGTGDPSIDHRRTGTLRRFFARNGVSLPLTDFAEDYLPGDIVTYYRASGRNSQAHIAIVSDVIAPSGRPMIVHNRGWGPQLEDALFASQVTGHFRFMPAQAADEAAERDGAPFAKHAAAEAPIAGADPTAASPQAPIR